MRASSWEQGRMRPSLPSTVTCLLSAAACRLSVRGTGMLAGSAVSGGARGWAARPGPGVRPSSHRGAASSSCHCPLGAQQFGCATWQASPLPCGQRGLALPHPGLPVPLMRCWGHSAAPGACWYGGMPGERDIRPVVGLNCVSCSSL